MPSPSQWAYVHQAEAVHLLTSCALSGFVGGQWPSCSTANTLQFELEEQELEVSINHPGDANRSSC